MEKARIMAVKKEISVFTKEDGTKISQRELVLGFARDGYDGFVPDVRSGISKTGKAYGIAVQSLNVDLFGTYVPKVGDMVNVEYNRYGNIAGISKAQ